MLTLDKIYHAKFVLKKVARKTDLIAAPRLCPGTDLYLKTENLQVTGSFKVRGAYYKISQLSEEERAKGVIACSAGNHAQGVALAATRPLVTKLMKKDIKPTNADRVLGGSARVTERIDNDVPTGAVYIDGKTWSARSSTGEIIEPDAMVRVIRMEGVKLYVEKEA